MPSRSSSTAAAPSSTNSASIVSSSATRLITIALPSIASRPPAITASSVERNSRFAISIVTSTSRMPQTATEMRQPNGSSAPKTASPRAMIHLPIGGCATNDGRLQEDLGVAGVEREVRVGRPRALVAQVRQRVRVLDVVGLVEDELVRMAEPDEAGQDRDQHHERRRTPGPGESRARARHQPLPRVVEARPRRSSMCRPGGSPGHRTRRGTGECSGAHPRRDADRQPRRCVAPADRGARERRGRSRPKTPAPPCSCCAGSASRTVRA